MEPSPSFPEHDIIICSLYRAIKLVDYPDDIINKIIINSFVDKEDSMTMIQLRELYRYTMSSSPRQAVTHSPSSPSLSSSCSSYCCGSIFAAKNKPIAFVAFCQSSSTYIGSVCVDASRSSKMGIYGHATDSMCITRLDISPLYRSTGVSTMLIKHAINYVRNTMHTKKLFIWATDYWMEQAYLINHGFYTCFTRSTSDHPRLRLMAIDL